MTESSRRGFLTVAGAGAAAVGLAAVAPSAAATPAAASAATQTPAVPAHVRGAVVAHVADVHGDTVTLFMDEREVVVHDRELVRRLAQATTK